MKRLRKARLLAVTDEGHTGDTFPFLEHRCCQSRSHHDNSTYSHFNRMDDSHEESTVCSNASQEAVALDEATIVEEAALERGQRDFAQSCRLAKAFGIAAANHGSSAGKIEVFLTTLMDNLGYPGCVFRCAQSDLFCCFKDENGSACTEIVTFQYGFNLHKLGMLADLAKECIQKHTDYEASTISILERLSAIHCEANLFEDWLILVSFIATSSSIAMIFGGSWLDVFLAAPCGALAFWTAKLFDRHQKMSKLWSNIVASFLCTVLAMLVKLYIPQVNVALVTLSGVVILLPGYEVSLGTQELVSQHILSGMTRLINGLVALVQLTLGYWLGKTLVTSCVDIPEADFPSESVSEEFKLLFAPIIMLSLTVVFQSSRQDAPWALLGMIITYGTTLVTGIWTEKEFGIFVSSVVMTVYANSWALWKDRPASLVLLPSFILQVSGSLGFLGLVDLVEGKRFLGLHQFLDMFVVALLIVAGMFIGNTAVPCETTL